MSGTNREGKKDARLRMEARAKLNDPSQPPRFIYSIVEPRRENGVLVPPPIVRDYRIARSGDLVIRREPGESADKFLERATAHWPATGPSWPFTFLEE